MGAPRKRNTVMTLFGQKEALLLRFGSMKNIKRVFDSSGLTVPIKSAQRLQEILDGEDCTEDESQRVEKAIRMFHRTPLREINKLREQLFEVPDGELTITRDQFWALYYGLCAHSVSTLEAKQEAEAAIRREYEKREKQVLVG